jgi:hypothetical protein
VKAVIDGWNRFWFRPVPPHQYALLRIVWGLLGLLGLLGVSDIDAFWRLDGLVSPTSSRLQAVGVQLAGPSLAPVVAFGSAIAIYVFMIAGVASPLTVLLAFVAAFAEISWNRLPLSAAYQTHLNLLFCLVLADCGRIWSVDAWWRRRRRGIVDVLPVPIWPLRLFRFQVCVIYFMSGWWKFQDVHWRDGSALHYVLNNVQFRRFPIDPPTWSAEPLTIATYVTLFWELLFPLLILSRWTRWATLGLGLMLHLGMWMTIELGPFSFVMIASYLAFIEPDDVPGWALTLKQRLQGHRPTVAPL